MPTLIYDRDCGFCRRWVERFRGITGDRVEYLASADAAKRFPNIPAEVMDRAVVFVESDGTVREGARAVFGALGPLWLEVYERLPGFAPVSEWSYGLVARNRMFFSRVTRLLWGEDLSLPTYHLARWLFLKGMALCYGIAFVSFAVQAPGLVGPRGIMPAPGLDPAMLAWAGAGLSVVFLFGLLPSLLSALLWLMYRQVYLVGGVFLGFQWDILLLEAGVLAFLLAPWGIRPRLADARAPSTAALWLVRWLWFRLVFLSALVKLASGDALWSGLTALSVHYETQPLPTVGGWWAHQLPAGAQRFSCAVMFFIELVLPLAIFLPRRPRLAAFLGVNLLMLLIAATGNYTFFNLLAFVLSLPLLDDSLLGRKAAPGPREPRARRALGWAFAAFVVPVSIVQGLTRVWTPVARDPGLQRVAAAGHAYQLVSAYGLFAVMTPRRGEIVVEGTVDGREWKAYEFRWKPGDPARRPGWVQPHQPRLDWQMWFAALSPYQHNGWYLAFLQRLLEGSPEVRGLLANDPFPAAPPKAIRSLFYEYKFTDAKTRRETGAWWRREFRGMYAPILTLMPDGRLAALAPPGD